MPVFTRNWSAGNSLFTSVYDYRRSIQGVDSLYPEMWHAEDCTVVDSRVQSASGTGLIATGFTVEFTTINAAQGFIEVECTPSANVLSNVSPGVGFAPLIHLWNAAGVHMMGFSLDSHPQSRGNPYRWDIFVRDFAGNVFGLTGGTPPTFVAGQSYTFRVSWKCGTPTGSSPITAVASDGYMKWYLDDVLIHEELNQDIVIDAANNNLLKFVGFGADTILGGGGLFGSSGSYSISDVEWTPSLPSETEPEFGQDEPSGTFVGLTWIEWAFEYPD